MLKVLLVDDDVELTSMLCEYLTEEGFQVQAVSGGEEGVAKALSSAFDIVVLDVMMPRMSGIEVLRRIREKSRVPVLMLTARGDNIDKISGLDLGADDYVPKPCSPGELVARIRAIMRRVDAVGQNVDLPNVVQCGDLILWPGRRHVEWHGEPLELTGTEFSILEVLAREAGQLVSRKTLSLRALGQPPAPFDRRIDVHISSIRQKLGKRKDGMPWIKTVRGMGYQFLIE